MEKGTVQWFNSTKGFGFIKPEAGGGDIFVHIRQVELAGLDKLTDGQSIGYEIENNKGKKTAINLQLL